MATQTLNSHMDVQLSAEYNLKQRLETVKTRKNNLLINTVKSR